MQYMKSLKEVRKPWMIYPEDTFKTIWNCIIIGLLIAVGIFVPFRVCFVDYVIHFFGASPKN